MLLATKNIKYVYKLNARRVCIASDAILKVLLSLTTSI